MEIILGTKVCSKYNRLGMGLSLFHPGACLEDVLIATRPDGCKDLKQNDACKIGERTRIPG